MKGKRGRERRLHKRVGDWKLCSSRGGGAPALVSMRPQAYDERLGWGVPNRIIRLGGEALEEGRTARKDTANSRHGKGWNTLQAWSSKARGGGWGIETTGGNGLEPKTGETFKGTRNEPTSSGIRGINQEKGKIGTTPMNIGAKSRVLNRDRNPDETCRDKLQRSRKRNTSLTEGELSYRPKKVIQC